MALKRKDVSDFQNAPFWALCQNTHQVNSELQKVLYKQQTPQQLLATQASKGRGGVQPQPTSQSNVGQTGTVSRPMQVRESQSGITRDTQKVSTHSSSVSSIEQSKIDPVRTFELKHNKKAIQNMSDHEFAQSIANRAERKGPNVKGPKAGREKHDYAARLLEEHQKLTGQRQEFVAEQRYKGGEVWRQGMGLNDSVVVDLRNTKTGQTFDYKFGGARVTERQRQRYATQLPKNPEGTLADTIQIKPEIKVGK